MAKKQAQSKLYVSFILDETGSMQSVKGQTISGFNEYVETLKNDKASKNTLFTLTQFNNAKVDIVHNCVPIADVVLLTDKTYQPANNTPLYDAIGRTIRSLEQTIGKKKANALVVIQTDGQENSSHEFNRQGIFSLIDEKKKAGWTFAFLGADQDAYAASELIGISKGNTMNYAGAQTKSAFAMAASQSRCFIRSGGKQTNNLFDDDKDKQ